MTMNCAEWEERLNAALDGELAAADRAPLEAHLASCVDCRRTRDALQAQSRELEGLRFDSAALAEKIIAAVHAEPAPRRVLRGFLALAAAAAILIGILLLLPAREQPAVRPWMTLEAATCPVEERVAGAWRPLPSGQVLRRGTEIRTGVESKCEFSCEDGSLLRLDASTEVRIHAPRSIHLREGELFAKVAAAREPFRFTTEDGGLRAEGGVLDLSYRPSTRHPSKFDPPVFVTSLAVLEGRAKIVEQDVPALNSCIVERKVAGTPEPVDALLRTRWIHDLLKLKDRQDPEVGERVTALLAKLGRTKTPQLYEREIRALGERSAPALLAALLKPPDGLSAYDRREAARLLADLAGPPEVEGLVSLTRDGDGDVWTAAHRALARITGANFKGFDAWHTWYQENRHVWACPKK